MNCLLALIFGISLEGFHGPIRMFIMFNSGVLGGACCYLVSDVHTRVVGMSGGCYALLGMHFGDLIINFHEESQADELLSSKEFTELRDKHPEGKTVEDVFRGTTIIKP